MRGLLRAAIVATTAVLAAGSSMPQGTSPSKDSADWRSFCPSGVGSALEMRMGVQAGCSAYGFHSDEIATTGWGYLHVETDHSLGDAEQAYAAGVAEGYLTAERIQQSLINTFMATFPNGTVPQVVYEFTDTQQQWVAAQAAANPSDPYWINAQFLYTQVQGLVDGVILANLPDYKPISYVDMLVLNLAAEVGDMEAAVNPTFRATRDVLNMHDIKKVKATMEKNSHCSALIRLAPDGSDMFSAHTTWTGYFNMLRTYKYINVAPKGTVAEGIQFSSYPGCLSSVDDYYQSSAGLIVIETTNNVANMSLYEYVVPQTIPTFVRVMMATRMANTGSEWNDIYSQHNSGTYNNQWMVVDNKQFTAGDTPRAGTLWIVSQIPGQVVSEDVTPVLISRGFWPSYNIPYFKSLWSILGYESLVQQYGAEGEYLWSYSDSFRALIFARDAPKVKNIADMQAIIQENNWQTDPLSHGSADLAIASRMDLATGPLTSAPDASGAIDAKLSSASWMANAASGGPMTVLAKSGPTFETQAPFQWSKSAFNNLPHIGLPDLFNFDWVNFAVQPLPAPEQARPVASAADLPTFNVEQYGAKGDGETDCTAAVVLATQALLNSAGGGTLLFPAGTWRLTGTPSTDVYMDLRNTLGDRTYTLTGAGQAVTTLLWDPSLYELFHVSSAGSGGNFISVSIANMRVQALNVTDGRAIAFTMDGDSLTTFKVSSIVADATEAPFGALVRSTGSFVTLQDLTLSGLFLDDPLTVLTPVQFLAQRMNIVGDAQHRSASALLLITNQFTQSATIQSSIFSGFVNSVLRLYCSTEGAVGQCALNSQVVLQDLSMANNSYFGVEVQDLSIQLSSSLIECAGPPSPSLSTVGVYMFSGTGARLPGLAPSLLSHSTITGCGLAVGSNDLDVSLDYMNLQDGLSGVFLQGTVNLRLTNSRLNNNTQQALNTGLDHPTWTVQGNTCANNGQDFVFQAQCATAGACNVDNNNACTVTGPSAAKRRRRSAA